MELSSSSSDEENFEAEFWNNWLPSPNSVPCEVMPTNSSQAKRSRENVFPSRKISFISCEDHRRFGNWIPPDQLLSMPLKMQEKTVLKKGSKQSQSESLFCENFRNRDLEDTSNERKILPGNITAQRKELNLCWGKRIQLHDVTSCNDGDMTWGIINLGIFANIRLWVNECGNVSGLAEGKITKLGSSEVTFICIKNSELLRKMLGLSGAQWASLCETVQETKTILRFDAFEVSELTTKTSLEKLWFFICKRRHFLPNQCMLVKLYGAKKCFRTFKITTKLIVEDIRNLLGQPIK